MRISDIVFPPRADEKLVRDVTAEQFLSHLRPRIAPVTRPAATTLLPFSEEPVRAAVHEAKYHGARHARDLLAAALTDYLQGADTLSRKVMLVPIPLGARRRKERGFNQVEEVCRRAVSLLDSGHPFALAPGLLRRTRETASQVSLPRHKREINMRGAFNAAHSVDPSLLYIVIDDVLTTGATLQAAIDALHTAGATNIAPLALAH